RIEGDGVFVIGGGEAAEEEGNGDHILDAMIAIGGVPKRTFLVDDAEAGFVGADRYFLDGFGGEAALSELVSELHCCLDGGLRMEFGRIADLEEHVFHD